MAGINYKEYTPEESKIYDATMVKIREGVRNGLGFEEACGAVSVDDAELKRFIVDDALKVIIAEMHYGGTLSLPQVAETLRVPVGRIYRANIEMLEDVGISASEAFRQSSPGAPTGTA